ncbi:MAG: protein kinase domain-containing protein [Pyrinomonadaceae bacterium]
MSLHVGTKLGRYEIRSPLGEGGMGEVYLAMDTELGRPVALKFLHAEVAADERRMNRFIQEAKAASALNHPNIVTVYDVGRTDEGVRFFATELIDGETLRERMGVGAMKLGEVLDVAIQIASALVAAHAAGIVHRDIKPENVMLRRDGYVKVLDFGLAKMTGAPSASVDTQAATRALVNTDPGSVMGTVAYMSPEQASGKETDARTDIWSLGVVLYEMLAGRVPFAGKSLSHTIVAILDEEPPPLARFMPDAPEALQEIVSDALAKDLDARFQTSKQMLAKLRRLKGRLDAGAHLDRSLALDPSSLGSGGSQSSGADTIIAPTPTTMSPATLTARTNEAAAATTTVSSAENLASKNKRYGRGALVALALCAVVVAVAAFGLYKYFGGSRSVQPSGPVKVTPLTSDPGVERSVAFSPDGRQVAFAATGEPNNFDIYIKIAGAGEALRLTTDPEREMSPVFSPDGRFIAFLRGDGAGKGFYLIPALGGAERKLSDFNGWNQNGVMPQALDWSPDGKTLAIVDKTSADEPWGIFLLSVETGERRRLTQAPPQYQGDTTIAFSPDGSRLAFTREQNSTGDIYLIPTAGGEPMRLTSDEAAIHGLAWTPDGASLVFSSERGGGGPALWKMAAVSGSTPAPVIGVGANVHDMALSRQGDRLAYAQLLHDINIYRIELTGQPGGRKAGAPSSLISSTRTEDTPQFSPDGRKVAFVSDRSGSEEVWTCDAEGKNPAQLTRFGAARVVAPGWSSDGRFVVFESSGGGNADIYAVGVEGGAPRRLTNEPSAETTPSWSRDGQWIYFASNRTGRSEVWKMPAAGGAAVQLTRGGGTNPLESPDGREVYFIRGRREPDVWQVSVDGGGDETRVCEGKITTGNWAVAVRGIYFLDWQLASRSYMLGFFDFATRKTTQLAKLEGAKASFNISGITVAPDERQILFAQRDQLEFDLMLVENFH